MGNRSALDLMGSTERAILTILWRHGPTTVAQLQTQLGGALYTTMASPLQSFQKKGFVTKTGSQMDYRYHALPKQALLVLASERHLAELGGDGGRARRPCGGAETRVIWTDDRC
jgi:predicted transcriptional regulator